MRFELMTLWIALSIWYLLPITFSGMTEPTAIP